MTEMSLVRMGQPTDDPKSPLYKDRSDIAPSGLTLWEFVNQAWPVLNPGRKFKDNWHIGAICEHLTAVRLGQIRNLVINQPPRTTKSTVANVCFPSWIWADEPWFQFLCISHAEKLAMRDNVAMRRLVTSPWYTSKFSNFRLTTDQNQKGRYENDWSGHRIAFGMLSGGTGEGGDGIIFDDPMDRDNAFSEAERLSSLEAFDEKWSTRINDPSTGWRVVVMQRLHEADVSGHCLADLGYEHLCLPMHFDPDRKVVTSIGWSDPRTEPQELLWPEHFPESAVKDLEAQLGHAAAGQLEQRPAPRGGSIVKVHWLRYWQYPGQNLPPVQVRLDDATIWECAVCDLPSDWDEEIQSWDMSFKDKSTSSKVAGAIWGRKGATAYLRDQVCELMDFSATSKSVLSMCQRWPSVYTKLVESKANGPAIVSALRDIVGGFVEIEPDGSKEARLYSCQPNFEGGNVVVPHPSLFPWVNAYVAELTTFPASAFDDQVDQTTQALTRLIVGKVNASQQVFGHVVASPETVVYTPF